MIQKRGNRDHDTATEQNLKLYLTLYEDICKTKLRKLSTYYISTSKMYKLILLLSNQNNYAINVKIFDGPDDRNRLMKLDREIIPMSTFQCYLELDVPANRGVQFYVNFTRKLGNVTKYYIHDTKPFLITLNMCQSGYSLYCIFNISTQPKHPNISITNMVYSGPDYDNCRFGGIYIYQGNMDTNKHTEKHMCDNYTSNAPTNSFELFPMSFVGSGNYAMVMIFSYPPYSSTMEANITVLVSQCKGFMPCAKGM